MGFKRKREARRPVEKDRESESASENGSDYEIVPGTDSVDISSALTGLAVDDSDDDIEGLIRSQQDKQNLKAGAQAVKRAVKGQSKQGASAVGGGSFQSMGEHKVSDLKWQIPYLFFSTQVSTLHSCVHWLYADTRLQHRSNAHPFPRLSPLLPETWSEWLGRALERPWLI